MPALYGHQIGFFSFESLVDFGNVLVRQLLDIVLTATLLVFADFLFLDQVLS